MKGSFREMATLASPIGRRALLTGAAGTLLGLNACGQPAPRFTATDVSGAGFGRALNMLDADGVMRSLADFRGRYVILFFGYTQCPNVCPTALSRALEVRRLMGKDGARLQVVFVTIDPERDTPQLLKTYMAAFDPSFVALRGDAASTQAAAKEFKIFYQKARTSTSYTMDHTTISYVLDDRGRIRLALKDSESAQEVAADLKSLIRES